MHGAQTYIVKKTGYMLSTFVLENHLADISAILSFLQLPSIGQCVVW